MRTTTCSTDDRPLAITPPFPVAFGPATRRVNRQNAARRSDVAQTACDHDPVKVTGKALVGAPAGAVWAMLADPDVLARAIPGCQSLDVTGPGRCAATVAIAIAAVSGTYAGDAQIRGRREPSMIAAAVSAAGARGSIAADVTVLLAPAGGGTEVGYEIDARVSGPIAAAGQLVLAAIAKRLAGEFLAGLDAA